jgi:hypothetical protein
LIKPYILVADCTETFSAVPWADSAEHVNTIPIARGTGGSAAWNVRHVLTERKKKAILNIVQYCQEAA